MTHTFLFFNFHVLKIDKQYDIYLKHKNNMSQYQTDLDATRSAPSHGENSANQILFCDPGGSDHGTEPLLPVHLPLLSLSLSWYLKLLSANKAFYDFWLHVRHCKHPWKKMCGEDNLLCAQGEKNSLCQDFRCSIIYWLLEGLMFFFFVYLFDYHHYFIFVLFLTWLF